MNGRIGVVVMSYGSPGRPEDVEAFYTDVRRGRPPSPEQLADLERRYDAIGGTSGLAGRTLAQARALEAALQGEHPGRYRVFAGAKHSAPFIEDPFPPWRRAGWPRPSASSSPPTSPA
jgi:ferrochelatase